MFTRKGATVMRDPTDMIVRNRGSTLNQYFNNVRHNGGRENIIRVQILD